MDTALFIHPITKQPAAMPIEMVAAYVPFASYLHLEDAAKVAAIRDDEAADNLLLSIATEYPSETFPEGAGYDRLSVEAPSLR